MVNKYIQVLRRAAPSMVSLFSSMYTMVQVFPYLPWMVQHLIPDLVEKDIGYYSGLIATFQFIGRILGSFIWGWLTDKYGRRIVLIISGLLLAVVTLGFGFSTSVIVAIIFRFFVGFFNGIVPTVKAVVSEYSDDTTQAFAMGLFGGIFSLGLVFGSGFSGLLADPIMQYDIPRYEIFVKFPYVLPGVANAVILVIGVLVVYFFMEEPVRKQKKKQSATSQDIEPCSSETETDTEGMLASADFKKVGRLRQLIAWIRRSTFYSLMTDWVVMLTILLYSIFSLVTMSLDEVLPLWSKTPHDLGGLSMSIRKFSIIISVSALLTLPFSLSAFHLLERCVGGLRAYHIAVTVLIPVLILLPTAAALPDVATMVYLGFLNLVLRVFVSVVFAALAMFTNNSVSPEYLGAVNGLSLSMCSVFRAIAPIYGGTVFAVSLNSHTFPFDFHLIFILNGIALVLCILFGLLMPKSLNSKKKVKSETLLRESNPIT